MAITTLTAGSSTSNFNYSVTRAAAGKSNNRLTDDVASLKTEYKTTFTLGTGANQINQVYQDKIPLATSANTDLNISGGAHAGGVALVNEFGEAISFTAIKEIIIKNVSAAATIRIGGEATNGFTAIFADNSDMASLPAGAVLHLTNPSAAGWAVAADEVLQITNTDGVNAATVEIAIGGLE